MHDMPPLRAVRRPACTGESLDVVWKATLRAESAWARCGSSTVARPQLRRRMRGGHLGAAIAAAPLRRPPGGRATGRLAR